MAVPEIRMVAITGMPEVRPSDDLAEMLLDAAGAQDTRLHSGDVLVVTQKIVSKAENRLVRLADVKPSAFASSIARDYDKDARLVEVVLQESRRIVRMDKGIIITENRLGHICANAGIDASNMGEHGTVALLPADPDRWCSDARTTIKARLGVDVAVIMSDTFGRPWREGCTNVAIGVAGMEPMVDYRGQVDPAGMTLRVSVLAVADELASAAELLMGKFARIPAVIIRGYPYLHGAGKASQLLREPGKDLFR